MEEQAKKIAELLKILANEHRLLVLCALMKGPLSVSELHSFTPNITSSALSQHLSQLKLAGILESEKQGMNVIYRILDPRVTALLRSIKDHLCPPCPPVPPSPLGANPSSADLPRRRRNSLSG